MLSITEEERAIFDEKKKFSIKANMDDASLLGDLYLDLFGLLRPGNEEHDKILNIIYKRAMRVIEETCKNKEGYDYNRNIEAVLAEALQKVNNNYQDYLNSITVANPQESIISDLNFLIFLDKEKLIQYIAKKEVECKDLDDLKDFYKSMSNTSIDVQSTVEEALYDLDVILPALDLAISEEHNIGYNDEWVDGDIDDSQESDEQTNELVNDSDEGYALILEDYDDTGEEIDSWDDLVEEITEAEEDKSTEITPEKFKKFAEMLELFPRIGEIQQNLSEEMNKLWELIRQRTLEDFKSNPIFVSDLEVIMKHSKEEGQYHYHGTQDLESAAQILKQGLLMTRDLASTSYSEFTMDELLLYERGFGGEIGSSGIVIIDQPIVDGKRTEIVEELEQNHGYSFVPSGLQGLNNKPENIVQAQYIVGYVDKINRKVVLNPLYYGYKKKLEEMEAKRKTITKKTELDGVDILTAGSSAEVDRCDEMDMVLGTITKELTIDDKNQEIND